MKKLSVIRFLVLLVSVVSGMSVWAQEPGGGVAPPSENAVTLTAKEVRVVQQALFNRGYLMKQPSGILDAETRQAVRDFQKAQSLEVTGKIDTATLAKLGLSVASRSAA